MKRGWCAAVVVAATFAVGQVAWAGPVIIDGSDLTDHGSRSSGGVNLSGWLYIEEAIANLQTNVTRAGVTPNSIAVLGSSDPGAPVDPTGWGGDAGQAIKSVAANLGKTVTFHEGSTAINQFFTDLASGAINPEIIWTAGTGAANDLDSSEGTALVNNAAALNAYGASGGGIMGMGSGTTGLGWVATLLPGLNFPGGCQSRGATLTAAGNTAFPGLSNANIQSGPCHGHFTGNFGGLQVLANDGQGRPFILGGGAGTIITGGTVIPEPGTMALFGLGSLGVGFGRRRRTRCARKA